MKKPYSLDYTIERDTDRQGDVKRPYFQAGHVRDVFDQEIGILKESQDSDVEYDRNNEQSPGLCLIIHLLGLVYVHADNEVKTYADQHKYDINRLTPGIEDKACYQEYEIFYCSIPGNQDTQQVVHGHR